MPKNLIASIDHILLDAQLNFDKRCRQFTYTECYLTWHRRKGRERAQVFDLCESVQICSIFADL